MENTNAIGTVYAFLTYMIGSLAAIFTGIWAGATMTGHELSSVYAGFAVPLWFVAVVMWVLAYGEITYASTAKWYHHGAEPVMVRPAHR